VRNAFGRMRGGVFQVSRPKRDAGAARADRPSLGGTPRIVALGPLDAAGGVR